MENSPLTNEQWKYALKQLNNLGDYYCFFLLKKHSTHFEVQFASDLATEYFGDFSINERAETYFTPSNWQSILQSLQENKKATIQFIPKNTTEKMITTTLFKEIDDVQQLYLLAIDISEQYDLGTSVQHRIEPLIGLAPNGKILYGNRATIGSLGYRNQKFIHSQIDQIITSVNGSPFLDILKTIKETKKTAEYYDATIRTIEGKTYRIYLRITPIIVDCEIVEFHCIWRHLEQSFTENQKLFSLHYYDQLTGIWNKQALTEHFLEESRIAQKNQNHLAILLVDVLRFKRINESYGTNIGDEILCAITQRLKTIESTDIYLYRLNGDEFIIMVQNATDEKILAISEKVNAIFLQPFTTSEIELDCDYSIGVTIQREEAVELESMLQQAMQAVYFSMVNNQKLCYYEPKMEESYRHDALMESHLRRAVEKNELHLHFQPQIDLSTGKVESFEALLRWTNPKFGDVSPVKFIPIAEESGIIVPIGDWVLEEVAKILSMWKKRGWLHLRIAVNISPLQFKEESFIEKMRTLIEHYELEPSMLELEITESSMMDVDKTMIILSELKEMNMVISVDDFGTGYSSLSYIKSYPIDIIKIDKSFIQEMDCDQRNQAIAKTIIHLAHSLGLTVIAEGVERLEHVSILKKENCEKAQGFLFSRPVPFDVIENQYLNKLN